MEIEPPTNAYAFVAAMYLNQEAPLQPRRQPTVRRANQPPKPAAAAGRLRRSRPTTAADGRIVSHEGVVRPRHEPHRADQIRIV